MDWRPDRKQKKPIYKQLAEFIGNGIADGILPPDQLLPSERQLASELQVNRSTVVAAYDELESIGLIERKRGSGTRISKDIWGLTKKRIPSWNRYVEAGSFLPNMPVIQRIRKEIEGHSLINLASGELSEDLFPLDSLQKIAASRPFTGRLGYDHPQGSERLRNTIVEHVKRYRRIETDSSSILVTSGAQQALHLIVQCLLKPGDAIVLENPSYHYGLPIFKSAGIRTFYLPVDQYGINPDDLESLYKKHRIRIIFLNPSYQNPTGAYLSQERRKKILDLSSQYGIPIVEDDPYSLTSFTGKEASPLKSMDVHGNVLYISSLSKIVASGLRIGWIHGPKSVIERLSDAKQQIDFGHGSYTQWIAEEFLESEYFSNHICRLVKQLKLRRDQIVISMKDYLEDSVEFQIPEGGIHIWCRINKGHDEGQLLENSIRNGVIYVPGSTMGTQKVYVRFTFAREKEEDIDMGIKRFALALRQIK
ncbi:PLP-dependent aminotransferase family protein [Peribacillus sp. B-H-3]|uniref:MocR-like pyridoxine biosynthesis transcription factor PdxR n=1 Tax=Peribacillus sp. B-H-3 TaxID=3400420 RepID=UPI003B010752